MPQFAANLTMLFTELPFLDRFEPPPRPGFKAWSSCFPTPCQAEDIKPLRWTPTACKLVLHNLPAGDWDAGERGIACHPDRVDEFRAGVAKAIDYATALGVPQLNCLAGKAPAGVPTSPGCAQTLVDNLRYAAAAEEGGHCAC
jgi:hydroxypyruvate isomerase